MQNWPLYYISIGGSPLHACVWTWLHVFFEQSTINTEPTAWYERRTLPFVDSLHFSTAFWVLAFWVFDIWHDKMYTTYYPIKVIGQRIREILNIMHIRVWTRIKKPMARFELATSSWLGQELFTSISTLPRRHTARLCHIGKIIFQRTRKMRSLVSFLWSGTHYATKPLRQIA